MRHVTRTRRDWVSFAFIFFVGVLSIMTDTIGEGPVNAISSLISDLDRTRKGDEFELC